MGDKSLERFRVEYEKLHRQVATKSSAHHRSGLPHFPSDSVSLYQLVLNSSDFGRALKKSHESEKRLIKKCRELNQVHTLIVDVPACQ